MFKNLNNTNSVPNSSELRILFFILLLSVFSQCFVLFLLPISLSNDSYGYIDLAHNLISSFVSLERTSGWERTIGYPFLIAISGAHLFDSLIGLIFIQSLMAISIPLLAYFTVRPIGLVYAVLASVLGVTSLFPYVMALQVLTELPFMFTLALFAFFASRYFFTKRLIYLVVAITATLAIGLIRVSGSAQFASFLGGMIVLIAFFRWSKGSFDKRLVTHFLAAIALFLGFTFIYGTLSNRTAKAIAPHFIFNWVYQGHTNVHEGLVRPENGPKTRAMFNALSEIMLHNPEAYRFLATGAPEPIQKIVKLKSRYDSADVRLLIEDLSRESLRSAAIGLPRSRRVEFTLLDYLGLVKGSGMMADVIQEALIAKPYVLWERLKVLLRHSTNVLDFNPAPATLYVTSYWYQVPKPGGTSFLGKKLRPNTFATWIHGLDGLSGTDLDARINTGRFPLTWDEAWYAFTKHHNYIAMGHYFTMASIRIAYPVWGLMILGVFFGFWSRNPALAITLLLAGTVPPIISSLVSELDARHLLMSYPLQVIAAVMSLEGALNLLIKFKARLLFIGR